MPIKELDQEIINKVPTDILVEKYNKSKNYINSRRHILKAKGSIKKFTRKVSSVPNVSIIEKIDNSITINGIVIENINREVFINSLHIKW